MSGALTIEVIHEPSAAEPFVVLAKPSGLASAPLKSLDEDSAFGQCARLFPSVKSARGKKEIEGGLLHRIDTATSGLLLVATSQEFYDHIISAQEAGCFVKGYRALCRVDPENANKLGAFPPMPSAFQNALDGLVIESRFRPYGKGGSQVRPVAPDSSAAALKKVGSQKLYSTRIVSADKLGGGAVGQTREVGQTGALGGGEVGKTGGVDMPGELGAQSAVAAPGAAAPTGAVGLPGPAALVLCKIAQGFRHQVRAHLAWAGLPILGDALYNADYAAALASAVGPSSAVGVPSALGARSAVSPSGSVGVPGGAGEPAAPMRFQAVSLDFPDMFSGKTLHYEIASAF